MYTDTSNKQEEYEMVYDKLAKIFIAVATVFILFGLVYWLFL